MILLKKVRLINWYGFTNITAPIGFFTLIAGKNGNGKSVLLDAIKYAAYGDTVFNKSSDIKGERSRTISSYTRGLLDATNTTYMRPADKAPNVYTHIALEYYDEVAKKNFILGTIIETPPSNNCQVFRYALDNAALDKVEHTYTQDGLLLPYSATQFRQRYKVELLNREQGLQKFLRMTGLKLDSHNLQIYLRKLRGLMTYKPEAKIDEFIRNSVLAERAVDFAKLIEAKENIAKLQSGFEVISREMDDLQAILQAFDALDNEEKLLKRDDIKIVYKGLKDLANAIAQREQEAELTRREAETVGQALREAEDKSNFIAGKLRETEAGLSRMDCAQLLEKARERLQILQKQKRELEEKSAKLERFQRQVDGLLQVLQSHGANVEEKDVLANLLSADYAEAVKQKAAASLRNFVFEFYDGQVGELRKMRDDLASLEKNLAAQYKIIEDCRKHRNAYQNIPDYVGLREEINRELAKRNLQAQAKFACEYVVALKDEAWRDSVEAFLGARRYAILVEPQYYDIADEVLNGSKFKYAHIFNTKLLMRKQIKVENDSVVRQLEIKNRVAQRYFDFQLGRMHGVKLDEARNFENAISVEGRVSVAMDSYFLRFDRIGYYYLGHRIFELNRKRAEKEAARLQQEKKTLLARVQDTENLRKRLQEYQEAFGEYDYGVRQKLQALREQIRESEKQYRDLAEAQKQNSEFMELTILLGELEEQKKVCDEEQQRLHYRKTSLKIELEQGEAFLKKAATELREQREAFAQCEVEDYALTRQAKEEYDAYLGGAKRGNILQPQSRERLQQRINQSREILYSLKGAYDNRNQALDFADRADYAARFEHIRMDDFEEVRQNLREQTAKYESVFKKEFVLRVYELCEAAKDDLRRINLELSKLNFAAKYQFEVRGKADGSDYAKILEYAKYLEERTELGAGEGELTLGGFAATDDERGEALAKELRRIIDGIMSGKSEDLISRFADYRNYMEYEILVSNAVLSKAKLSRQTGYNSGAEVQIPYLLILIAALLMYYNQKANSTRLAFIDEPFAKMDPHNVQIMLDFMKRQKLQMIFCSPDKTEAIGNECEVILPALRVGAGDMQLGVIQFHEEKAYAAI
ncbi:MAG: SbcC/MukB-like Walker B domain-containing protein [Phascolarctobacterium sp.]|uniref:SbcC/MukB-like Walker B domain-containing protein n=1 Tax=Phascolarctobacterium sp. TaxID=2049039 RepID=UPI0026DB1710|nr:SbcC/MukB-like Walker B domain-containing protein [Phascolarctobacterium sp.]MDO4921349.1 SbcC/MukB-like Walker B domain-containing protein [Phascolarctobacterium sp.]